MATAKERQKSLKFSGLVAYFCTPLCLVSLSLMSSVFFSVSAAIRVVDGDSRIASRGRQVRFCDVRRLGLRNDVSYSPRFCI